jgi:hypothetical protein
MVMESQPLIGFSIEPEASTPAHAKKFRLGWNLSPGVAFAHRKDPETAGRRSATWPRNQPSWRIDVTVNENRRATVASEENPERENARAIRARQRAIGRELRRMYDDVAQEPIPEDFLDLLKKIDETSPRKAS